MFAFSAISTTCGGLGGLRPSTESSPEPARFPFQVSNMPRRNNPPRLLASAPSLDQNRLMITGYNTDIRHEDRVYHIQTEDKGLDNPTIESLVYQGGKIIASRQYSYAWLLRQGYSEKTVQDLVDAQHKKMMRDIRGGKYRPEGPPPFGAGIITARGFDELVLEFLGSVADREGIDLGLTAAPPLRPGELALLDLEARGDLAGRPIAGARIAVTVQAPEASHPVILFEGLTGEDGGVRAGVEIPREAGGGTLVIRAEAGPRSGEIVLEIAP